MKNLLAVLFTLSLLAGCAGTPQQPVFYNADAIKPNKVIGVSKISIVEPNLALPGASCLLCIAAARAMNSDLTAYSKTLDTSDLKSLPEEVVALLKNKNQEVKFIESKIDLSKLGKNSSRNKEDATSTKYDFSPLKDEYGVDQMLFVRFYQIGTNRAYGSYIPKGPAQASVQGIVYMVDLNTNQYIWYRPIEMFLAAQGQWDNGPKFPELTNAYYQLVEKVRDLILTPFK